MRPLTLALLVPAGLLACAGSRPVPPQPLGAHQHLAEASRHEAEAQALDQRATALETTAKPTEVTCADQALADQSTSGGERLGVRAPCWTGEAGAIARQREAAARLRADARAHRAHARALMVTASEACRGLPDEELEHTPFDHREDLAAVSAEVAGGRVTGARIRFTRVPGLDAAWLRRSLTCHQALAAAGGYEPHYLGGCPATLPDTRIEVVEEPAGLVVVITAADEATALAVYGRAEALLDPAADHAAAH